MTAETLQLGKLPSWDWSRPFADELRDHMAAHGFTGRALGQRSGVDHSTITRLLDAARDPALSTALRVVDAFGCLAAASDGPMPAELAELRAEVTRLREMQQRASSSNLRPAWKALLRLRSRYDALAATVAEIEPPDALSVNTPAARKLRLAQYQRMHRALIDLDEAFDLAAEAVGTAAIREPDATA